MALIPRQLSTLRNPPPPVNFALPTHSGQPLLFDTEYRARGPVIVVWYRGHW